MANLPATKVSRQGSFSGNGYQLQPRINLRRDLIPEDVPATRTVWGVFRRQTSAACHDGSDYNTCEKGINTNVTNLAIILGIVYVAKNSSALL